MNLFLHHCNIYKDLFTYKDKLILLPEISPSIEDLNFINKIEKKISSIYGEEPILFLEDIYISDASLIDELKNEDVFIIFFCTCEDNSVYSYWDKNISIDNLCFLGWSIINNANDSAITDGMYPIIYEDEKIIDLNSVDLNYYSLLDDSDLAKYLEKNKNEVRILINDVEQEVTWMPIGIFCDKYTYNKLQLLK